MRSDDYKYLRLLKLAPFKRHHRGGWRFGTRRIGRVVVLRLVAAGRAEIDGQRVRLVRKPAFE
jgi:hypothetical protein